ncbi:MAG TPA: alpha/beta hydrolase, partial [Candidatus Eisenbacteria bacterium]|nr:alpha/beta hydrolase [Candidatus Eisenbacteria bacterium]
MTYLRALVLVLAMLLGSCRWEERLIFYPTRALLRTPQSVGLAFEDTNFSTSDGVRLHGWFISHAESPLVWVWFHGNAGNISHRVENIKLLHELVKIRIFIFDYRGYGASEGSPSEKGTYLDGEAAVRCVIERYGVQVQQMVFFGRSLGAAIAAEMATRWRPLALILESPFVSIPEMAKTIFPYLPLRPVLRTRYDLSDKIGKVTSPVLVLHGVRDEIVPFEQGRKVFDQAPGPKRFYAIDGAGHNDTYLVGGTAYF